MFRIIYKGDDGVLKIVTPISSLDTVMKRLPNGARPVELDYIPEDRTFRNAWIFLGGKIVVDMNEAKKLHLDYLRQVRKPIFEQLDIQYMLADEKGDDVLKSSIANEKQKLRDATQDPIIDAAKTPEELKAAIPMVLRRVA